MGNFPDSYVVIGLIGFLGFVFVLSYSLDIYRYGPDVARRLRKRTVFHISIIFLVSPIYPVLHDRLQDWFSWLLLCALMLWWIWVTITQQSLKPMNGEILYTFEMKKRFSPLFSLTLFLAGSLFTGLSYPAFGRPSFLTFLALFCLGGAIYLLETNKATIQFSNLALRDNCRDVYWQDVKMWLWTEKKWEHQWLVLQKKGFASDLRFVFVKFPVEEVKKVDAILQSVAPPSLAAKVA